MAYELFESSSEQFPAKQREISSLDSVVTYRWPCFLEFKRISYRCRKQYWFTSVNRSCCGR